MDFNPAAFETRYYWMFFSGDHNLVDQSYFKGKNNLEPVIGNALEGSRYNAVTNSYFNNVPYADVNGREIIRVWGVGKFDEFVNDGAYFTIQGNLFDHAHGEGVEIISLKSNFNKVIRNTIVDTLGGLNIRRGANNLVQGNIILCHGMRGASGLRMSGPNHVVEDNYVSNCDYGIRVSAGEGIATGFTDKFEPHLKGKSRGTKHTKKYVIEMYPQVTNSTGAELNVGSDYMKHWPAVQMVLLPEKNLIEGNRFVRPLGGASIVGATQDLSGPLSSLQFQTNQFRDNKLFGGSNSFPQAAGGVVNLPMPPNWTEKDESSKLKPLTPGDVGPSWVRSLRSSGNFPMEQDACCAIKKDKKI